MPELTPAPQPEPKLMPESTPEFTPEFATVPASMSESAAIFGGREGCAEVVTLNVTKKMQSDRYS